jgi:hypothetical protein
MKNIFATLLFCLVGCVTNAEVAKKPSGEIVFQSLLSAGNIELSSEPLCNMSSISMNKQNLLLSDHLATILSTSFESENKTTLTTSCSKSKHDLTDSKVIDVWDCMLVINENNLEKAFITSSTVAFSLDKDNYAFIDNSLRCF